MGAALASLHDSLRELSGRDLPRVAGLRASGERAGTDSDQLLHGDFNNTNMVVTNAGVRIFDFDDCGYGPVEFDLANALYVVLFDSLTGGIGAHVYAEFRSAFLEGYSDRAGSRPSNSTLDSLIDTRVRALEHWIANPQEAPIGIRESDEEWLEVLRQFVETWTTTTRNRP